MVIDPSRASSVALVAAVMSVASVAAVGWLQAQPRDASEVAAVFPPWMAQQAALMRVAAAGGVVVRQGVLDTILVVHGDDPGIGSRLYAEGALAVVDPVAFGGCLVKAPVGVS
ncbi:MAG: hypothetical protein ACLQJR_28735 [Stellaceae bacterium]